MSKRSSLGGSVVNRLAERSQGGVYKRQLPGGGEVYSGPTATRALRSLGARAFTMDSTIFVAEDFDPSDPEDQALYAHERHHQLNSGGDGAAQSYYDAEELSARAIERMVLHRSAEGEDFGSILRDVNSNVYKREADVPLHRSTAAAAGAGASSGTSGHADPAAEAYLALLQHGKKHADIVRMLASEIIDSLRGKSDNANMQGGDVGFV